MGQKIAREKPKKGQKKKQETQQLSFKGGNILDQKFNEGLSYRPKTNENKLIYENDLGKIYELVEDQPPETLLEIAD